jgi:hypothetical protein
MVRSGLDGSEKIIFGLTWADRSGSEYTWLSLVAGSAGSGGAKSGRILGLVWSGRLRYTTGTWM